MRRLAGFALAALLGAAAPASAARADIAPPVRGTDALIDGVGQTCMDHGEAAPALRAALTARGWTLLQPAEGGEMIRRRPGALYRMQFGDITMTMDSIDIGGCVAVTDLADPPALTAAVEAALTARGWKFFVALDEAGSSDPLLHVRRYHVLRRGEIWELIVATHPTAASHGFFTFMPLPDGAGVARDSELTP
jgi:hypothetical protein